MKSNKLGAKFNRGDSPLKITLIYVILIIACICSLYPILNILTVSLRPSNALFSKSLSIIPPNATFDNFKQAFIQYDMLNWLLHSLIVSSVACIFSVMLSVTAGYAFSRFKFRGKQMGLSLLLVTQMFPLAMTLLPLYLMLIKFNMTNSYFALAVIYVSTSIPFNIWMMKGFYDTIPKSLEESAYVDGASIFRSFYQIILPLAKPAVALTALFSFMGAWSEYIVASVIINETGKLTLPVGLVSMQGQFNTAWGIYSAGALITAVPVMILFICLSKYLVGGLTVGSVKG
ncbi:sugar ABC transporter permease [Clostridium estertheticum]|uniref:sugar ABC transporter permease n=1 Tax=Clostridium estertheticum TaxID=238834 RepID=UPI001C0DD9D6|nr:sugar ABC transporter permease [Clostridium estertheticum]MBU3072046.1 sugar ABC transporter permease [Clostridium estertheticum]MBU3162138.1 sugar ABC transporter permease [Clostridium estertheticum]